jgi:hypothetical protein
MGPSQKQGCPRPGQRWRRPSAHTRSVAFASLVCLLVCMYICMHVYVCVCVFARVCLLVSVHLFVCMYLCVYAWALSVAEDRDERS